MHMNKEQNEIYEITDKFIKDLMNKKRFKQFNSSEEYYKTIMASIATIIQIIMSIYIVNQKEISKKFEIFTEIRSLIIKAIDSIDISKI